MYKITIVGKEKVGKSNLQSTLGVDYSTKTANIGGKVVKFHIWDLAGQKSFKLIRKPYFMNTAGVILVYALNDNDSLHELKSWMKEIWSETVRKDLPLVFVANKSDLVPFGDEQARNFEKFKKEFIAETGVPSDKIDHVVTSALMGENIDQVFDNIFNLVVV